MRRGVSMNGEEWTLVMNVGHRRVLAMSLYVVILVSSVVVALLGGSILLLLLTVAAPVLLALRSRMSLAAALALLLVAGVWATLVVFVIARYTGIRPLVLVLIGAPTLSVLCAIHLLRRGSLFSREDIADLGFVGTGGLVWCAVLAVAAFTSAGSPISWSMTGDAANNILFARRLLGDGGVAFGAGQNPVPLTAAMIALFMLPGVARGGSVGAEIVALAQMWTFGIVIACVMSGALVLALVRRRSAMALVAVAGGSIVPLTWILLAGPVLLGFVNFHLTLALLCASLIAVVHAERAPVTAVVTISLSLAAVLALWAPLAGIPGTALVVVVASHWRVWRGLRRGRLAIVLIALAQPLAFFLLLSLPALVAQSSLLQEALGAVFEFPKRLVLVVLLAALVLGALQIGATRSFDLGRILIAVVGGGGVCLVALLWLRRNEDTLWSYYQLKYLWFLLALVMIVVVAAGLTLAAAMNGHAGRSALAAISVLLVISGAGEYARATVPTFSNDPAALRNPMVSIVTGKLFSVGAGDRVFHRVEELTSAAEPTVLWRSGDPDEDWILFWIIQMSAGSVDEVELRKFAYYHDSGSIDDLCSIRRLMGAPVAVITADPDVVTGALDTCPELGPVRLIP